MEPDCRTIEEALRELDELAPDVPLLALGQTVLWDEPMKAGVALALSEGSGRKFVAGVHDTDYFAKLPFGPRQPGQFRAFPHNGTSTRGLWSAAGEFSALFGSETVIQRQDLIAAGARLERVIQARPNLLDEVTEAYGWRGIVSLDDEAPLASSVPMRNVFEPLQKTLDWAVSATVEASAQGGKRHAEAASNELWGHFCSSFECQDEGSLTDFYADLLPKMYAFAARRPVALETTRTTALLRFNTETCDRGRFELVGRFLDPATAPIARRAYDAAIEGTEIYGLSRFGTGAIPFDLVVPGKGRGTLRIGNRGLVVASPEPLFASYKKPIRSVRDLAEVVEAKFGPDCVLIGKAVTLIGMLAREFVFVFHEGASGYVRHTREFHRRLREQKAGLHWNPILRIRYSPWDALSATCFWLRLPEPLRQAFGAEELCSPSFAARWKSVGDEQRHVLSQLGELRRPIDLIHFLESHVGGAWSALAKEYESLHNELGSLISTMAGLASTRRALYGRLREARRARVLAEIAKGEHFRSKIFERTPTQADLDERLRLGEAVEAAILEVDEVELRIQETLHEQSRLAGLPQFQKIHERRRAIELEAELKRIQLIRTAIIGSKGLERAGRRPSAWWFSILDPSGGWIRETWRTASCYFEDLSGAR